jgi:hypothetical protein
MTRPLARLTIAALTVVATLIAPPARAADPVFPAGSLIGLVPPAGLTPSENFIGFENREKEVGILMITLPAEAYAEMEKSASAAELKKQGFNVETREPFKLAAGKAFILIGNQTAENKRFRKWLLVASTPELTAVVNVQASEAGKPAITDAAIRAALASLAVRSGVPDEEKLSLLPFKVGELAGFKIGSVVPGRAMLLTDATAGASMSGDQARLVAIAAPGGPAKADDRDTFARNVFAGVPELKDVRITGSESLRIGGQQGHQILAEGKDVRTAASVTVVQWLRFGGGVYLQIVGVAPTDTWTQSLTRFRAVRDSIEPR